MTLFFSRGTAKQFLGRLGGQCSIVVAPMLVAMTEHCPPVDDGFDRKCFTHPLLEECVL